MNTIPTAAQVTADDADLSVPSLSTLATLSIAECEKLAGRIREFLITQIPRTGGHLGANLGTIELAIAIHRALSGLDTPIIWDTGHQAYTHKILTGRLKDFPSLRARDGLSGFPNRSESEHDLLENSHASVGPAWAHGVATSTGRTTVAVIGDGALVGGVAYEALTAIGYRGSPVVIVLNDNGRSYATTPSRLTRGEPLDRSPQSNLSGSRQFFEALGFSYYGPVDGHDLAALDEALSSARRGPLPCVVHACTQKGHGHPPALADDTKRLHDVSPAGPVPSARNWSTLAGRMLCDLAEGDDRVHAITAAMPDTLGLLDFRRRFPTRYHDLGIAEQASVAMAAGMASQGQRPFFYVVTTFLTRAIDQLLNDVALHELPVVFMLDRAGITGADGPSHHGVFDIGMLRQIPGIEIHTPATGAELTAIARGALHRDHGPLVIRYPKGVPVPDGSLPAGLIRSGSDACLITHGPTARTVLEATDILRKRHGLHCAVWRLTQLQSLDPVLLDYLRGHHRLVPVEEVSRYCGIEALLGAALASRPVEITPLTLPPGFLPHGSRSALLEEHSLSPEATASFVRAALERPLPVATFNMAVGVPSPVRGHP